MNSKFLMTTTIVLFVLIASALINNASAAVFLQILKAEPDCDSAVIGTKECFTTQVTAWTPESDNIPNPCYHNGKDSCWVFSGLRNLGNDSWVTEDEAVDAIDMKTVGDVRKAFIKQDPLPFVTTRLSKTVATNVCAAILYGPGTARNFYIDLYGDPQVFPTSLCALPPPPSGTCRISGDVIIDYGNVTSDNLSGLRAAGNATINCNVTTDVSLVVFSPLNGTNLVNLKEDKSLSAKLTINGTDASKGKTFSVNADSPLYVRIDSELIKSGNPDTGPFSGDAVAILSLP